MAMFLDIFFALLALGTAAVWILTARGELPPDWDPLWTMSLRHGPAKEGDGQKGP